MSSSTDHPSLQSPHRGPRRRPPRLRPGDRVAIVAPAGPVVPEKHEKGLALLGSWGLDVVEGRHVRGRHDTFGYLSGTDAERAEDLQAAWCDPDVRAVFCARGGYGSLRLLDLLDWGAMAAAGPKILIGSSDITAIHQVLGARLGLATIFGPMVSTGPCVDDEPAAAMLRTMLFEPEAPEAMRLAPPPGSPPGSSAGSPAGSPRAEAIVAGRARGVLTGGNLSLVVSGIGVRDVPSPPDGAIGLLEDVGEEAYRVDHFLTHLLRAGWFDRLGGVALGSWAECEPAADVRAVLVDRLATRLTELGRPLVGDLGFGHCEHQLTVPLGVEAELVSDPNAGEAYLALTEPALE